MYYSTFYAKKQEKEKIINMTSKGLGTLASTSN
jgi:hypothetical protein